MTRRLGPDLDILGLRGQKSGPTPVAPAFVTPQIEIRLLPGCGLVAGAGFVPAARPPRGRRLRAGGMTVLGLESSRRDAELGREYRDHDDDHDGEHADYQRDETHMALDPSDQPPVGCRFNRASSGEAARRSALHDLGLIARSRLSYRACGHQVPHGVEDSLS